MEVYLVIPEGTNIDLITKEYPDISLDAIIDNEAEYSIGNNYGDEESEWMSYEEAIEFCGFCDGVLEGVEGAYTLIEGNGQWAQGMLSRRDFSDLAITENDKAEYKRRSDIYHRGFNQGKKLILKR